MKNLINKAEKDRIDSLCEEYGIANYSINSDGSVDVNGSVWIHKLKLTEFPFVFGTVKGCFSCYDNMLTSLQGSPHTIEGRFNCGHNMLTSLDGCPQIINADFDC